ncbi:hypothetical protein SARC_02057, partial [Sphaeroforma arctica JP610]
MCGSAKSKKEDRKLLIIRSEWHKFANSLLQEEPRANVEDNGLEVEMLPVDQNILHRLRSRENKRAANEQALQKRINDLEIELCHAQDSGIDGDFHTLVNDDSAGFDSDGVLDRSERDVSKAERCDAASTAHDTESTANNSACTELEQARANLSTEQQSNAEKEDRIICLSAALEKTVAELRIARSDLIVASTACDAASAARDSARTELEQAYANLSAEQQSNAEKEDRINYI